MGKFVQWYLSGFTSPVYVMIRMFESRIKLGVSTNYPQPDL
ncbi:hypothetical protein ACN4EE_19030 [Geminocystis sp. CENA526]